MTYITHSLANIWLPEGKVVKYSTLVRLKTRFLSRWNPRKFDTKTQETCFLMRYDISKKIAADAAKFWPSAASFRDQAHKCSQFLFPVRISHHCCNKLFPVPFSVNPSLELLRAHPQKLDDQGSGALEIIIDIPIGFPINNIISQRCKFWNANLKHVINS